MTLSYSDLLNSQETEKYSSISKFFAIIFIIAKRIQIKNSKVKETEVGHIQKKQEV